MRERYDVVILGGGAAGLSAALTLGRLRRSTLVIDANEPRNAPAAHMHGYLSRDGMSPREFLAKGREEVRGYGGQIRTARVRDVRGEINDFAVSAADGTTVAARRVLAATGTRDELPDIPGLASRWGREVIHCPFCHGWEFRDAPIGVLYTHPRAVHQALMFRQLSDQVTLLRHEATKLPEAEAAKLAAAGISVTAGKVVRVETDGDVLSGVSLSDERFVALRALAIGSQLEVNAAPLASLGLTPRSHDGGFGNQLPANGLGTTAVPGAWVAGNLAEPYAQVTAAAQAGAQAAAGIIADLIEDDVNQALAHHPEG